MVLIRGAAAAPLPGRVIRVERNHGGVRRTPRVCQVQAADLTGTCWGRAPAIGEVATVIDQ